MPDLGLKALDTSSAADLCALQLVDAHLRCAQIHNKLDYVRGLGGEGLDRIFPLVVPLIGGALPRLRSIAQPFDLGAQPGRLALDLLAPHEASPTSSTPSISASASSSSARPIARS